MIILRILVFFIILWVVLALSFWLGRLWLQRKLRRWASQHEDTSQEKALVPCARCGTYVSKETALHREGHHYCCPAHAQMDNVNDKDSSSG